MARKKDWNLIAQESNDNFMVLVDEPDSDTTYVGKAKFGSLTSDAVWQIKKISVSGTVTTKTWAAGDDDFNQVWDLRDSLTYS